MGKMIEPRSIVVAVMAAGQQGNEGGILQYVFLHSLVPALVSVVVCLMGDVFPWMIPVAAK